MTKETNALNETTAVVYDALGNKTGITDRAGNTAFFTYDGAGRLIRQRIPFANSYYGDSKYFYDASGNLTKKMTQCNQPGQETTWKVMSYEYDSRNRRTKTFRYEDAGLNRYTCTKYVYDNLGNQTELHTGLTHNAADTAEVTYYTWNRFGQPLTVTDPQEQSKRYEYSALGVLLSKTDRNGNKTIYTTDALRRIKNADVSADCHADGRIASSNSYSYTSTGAHATEKGVETLTGKDPVQTVLQYTYNNRGLLKMQTDEGGITKTYTYDNNGNRKTFELKHGSKTEIRLSYEYDALNRLKKLYKDATCISMYEYNRNGRRSRLIYPLTNTVIAYTYNDANLVTQIESRKNTALITRWIYTYALDGSQVSKTDRSGRITRYAYDLAGRLSSEESPDGTTTRYEYDRFGNRRCKTVSNTRTGGQESVTTYTYTRNNQLILEELKSDSMTERYYYRYDANGNQCAREYERSQPVSADSDPGRLGFAKTGFQADTALLDLRDYNGFNQLIRVLLDGVETRYRYRPDGLRHSKSTGSAYETARNTTTHVWDGGSIVMELNANNAVIARYLRGGGLIARSSTSSGMQYYLFDAHGDVTHCGDMQYGFDAFGNQKDLQETDDNPFRYCGEYHDRETGEIYLRARYYEPRTGRFTSEDAARDGINWYVYCNNDPVSFYDPTGYRLVSTQEQHESTLKSIDRQHKYGVVVEFLAGTETGNFDQTIPGVNNARQMNEIALSDAQRIYDRDGMYFVEVTGFATVKVYEIYSVDSLLAASNVIKTGASIGHGNGNSIGSVTDTISNSILTGIATVPPVAPVNRRLAG